MKVLNRFEPNPYELKVKALQGMVQEEAQRLQNMVELKDSALREVRSLGARESELNKQSEKLGAEIKEKKLVLESIINTQTKYIESSKQELKKEEERLAFIRKEIETESLKLAEIQNAYKEIKGFFSKEEGAKIKYLEIQQKLITAQKEEEKINKELTQEKAEIEQQRKELDFSMEQMKEFSGHLTHNLNKVRMATEELNERLKTNNIPVRFGLPPTKMKIIAFE